MKYKVKLTKRAKKRLDNLEKDAKNRINNAFKNLIAYYSGEEAPTPDLKKLKGKYRGLLRLRVGNLRIVFRMEKDVFTILVIDIVSRSEAYKG